MSAHARVCVPDAGVEVAHPRRGRGDGGDAGGVHGVVAGEVFLQAAVDVVDDLVQIGSRELLVQLARDRVEVPHVVAPSVAGAR